MFEQLHALCHRLEQLPFAAEIRESSWMFPTLETVHVMALVIVVGSIVFVDTRLLGFKSRDGAFTAIAREMLPWTWLGFAVASLAGLLMFASKAATYIGNGPFQFKLLLLLSAKLAGACSLMLWIGVLSAGRWIGFTT